MTGSAASADPSDLELLRRAAAGDRESFGALFERYQHIVYRFARAMTGCPDAAEDVTQEVFVILMRELPRYVPERAALSTYLYGIARNVSRDRLRRARRRAALASLGIGPGRDEPAADPFERIASAETGAEVRRALACVPARYREVVILCDLHDLSYADVAAILRVSVAAVRSRLHRGRRLLKQRLAGARDGREAAPPALRCSYEGLVRHE